MCEGIEAVLLTGGASRRMGTDKSKLIVDGEELAARIARLLSEEGISVTIAGREAIGRYPFLKDCEDYAGPLAALSAFDPTKPFVYVASCDLVGFDVRVVLKLAEQIGDHDAAVPVMNGRLQPLCGLYRREAFDVLREITGAGERRVMQWLNRLKVVSVDDIDPSWTANANTPSDLPTDFSS